MIVGVLRIVLQIPGSSSLKAKRKVLRGVIDRVRARFAVSIAEVGDNDLWQRATLGVAVIGNEAPFVNEVLDKVLRSIDEGGSGALLVSHRVEILHLGALRGADEERTLAEAEEEGSIEPLDLFLGEDLPSLEELEAAAEEVLSAQRDQPPPERRPRKRRGRR